MISNDFIDETGCFEKDDRRKVLVDRKLLRTVSPCLNKHVHHVRVRKPKPGKDLGAQRREQNIILDRRHARMHNESVKTQRAWDALEDRPALKDLIQDWPSHDVTLRADTKIRPFLRACDARELPTALCRELFGHARRTRDGLVVPAASRKQLSDAGVDYKALIKSGVEENPGPSFKGKSARAQLNICRPPTFVSSQPTKRPVRCHSDSEAYYHKTRDDTVRCLKCHGYVDWPKNPHIHTKSPSFMTATSGTDSDIDSPRPSTATPSQRPAIVTYCRGTPGAGTSTAPPPMVPDPARPSPPAVATTTTGLTNVDESPTIQTAIQTPTGLARPRVNDQGVIPRFGEEDFFNLTEPTVRDKDGERLTMAEHCRLIKGLGGHAASKYEVSEFSHKPTDTLSCLEHMTKIDTPLRVVQVEYFTAHMGFNTVINACMTLITTLFLLLTVGYFCRQYWHSPIRWATRISLDTVAEQCKFLLPETWGSFTAYYVVGLRRLLLTPTLSIHRLVAYCLWASMVSLIAAAISTLFDQEFRSARCYYIPHCVTVMRRDCNIAFDQNDISAAHRRWAQLANLRIGPSFYETARTGTVAAYRIVGERSTFR